MTTRHFTISPDHPALPGHFPGRPVVPGVVLLDQVITAARRAFALTPATVLPRAKFAAPVLPGERVDVALIRLDVARIGFTCTVEGHTVATGELRFAA
ncbi:hydroxymyristoyl-ACP dehydratase [Roseomonas terrae]|uniref:Hydroxymyristoyl-ACP dehydratase n=1 Tax=Neoroseomonas terrae TaxID=424799 RepID=A0ABS5EPC8_9PROT|nr:hydroxymyristoyl-ACP dehydratase [Neoroseomonas terrae]